MFGVIRAGDVDRTRVVPVPVGVDAVVNAKVPEDVIVAGVTDRIEGTVTVMEDTVPEVAGACHVGSPETRVRIWVFDPVVTVDTLRLASVKSREEAARAGSTKRFFTKKLFVESMYIEAVPVPV